MLYEKTAAVLLLLILFVFSGCSPYRWSEIKDTNGEDRTLQTITDADFIKLNSSLSFISVSNYQNGKTILTIDKFSGVKTLETFSGGEYELTLTLKSDKGNIKLALCSGGAVIKEFEVGETEQVCSFDCSSGRVYFKLAGEEANVDLEYSYKKK